MGHKHNKHDLIWTLLMPVEDIEEKLSILCPHHEDIALLWVRRNSYNWQIYRRTCVCSFQIYKLTVQRTSKMHITGDLATRFVQPLTKNILMNLSCNSLRQGVNAKKKKSDRTSVLPLPSIPIPPPHLPTPHSSLDWKKKNVLPTACARFLARPVLSYFSHSTRSCPCRDKKLIKHCREVAAHPATPLL